MAKLTKHNCLAIRNPELCKEWDYDKNKMSPYEVTYASAKRVNWICPICNKGWETMISNRACNDSKCPYCSGHKVCKDNCLATVNPDLAKEWHPTENRKLTPYDFLPNSIKKVWWKCLNGHSWPAMISNRNHNKTTCPYCANKKVCKDNCLAVRRPNTLKLWHPIKNGKLTPYDFLPGSVKRVWWFCPVCNNEWRDTIAHRQNRRCSYCYGKMAYPHTCLAYLYPELKKMWHPTKNGKLTPYDFLPGSDKRVWWECNVCKKEWMSTVRSRVRAIKCPTCERGIFFKNGLHFDSIPEAILYLEYKSKHIKFRLHGLYDKSKKIFGGRKFDFYLKDTDTYVEVTSFSKKRKYYFSYLRNIVLKKRFVEKVLRANFKFIQFVPTYEQIKNVLRHVFIKKQ